MLWYSLPLRYLSCKSPSKKSLDADCIARVALEVIVGAHLLTVDGSNKTYQPHLYSSHTPDLRHSIIKKSYFSHPSDIQSTTGDLSTISHLPKKTTKDDSLPTGIDAQTTPYFTR